MPEHRTDTDIAALRRKAAELKEIVADPLAPALRHQREARELAQLTAIIAATAAARPPPRSRPGHPPALQGSSRDSPGPAGRAGRHRRGRRAAAGRPAARSTGALTVVQLAAEAGVKRWVLTHKHRDLITDFQQRARGAGKLPPAFQALQNQLTDLQAENRRLRADKRDLQERINLYAAVITELSAFLHPAGSAGTVTRLRPGPGD